MSFDDRIRDALGQADNAYHPRPAPIEALAANLARRRRAKAGLVGGGAAVIVALLGFVIANGAGTPDTRLDTAAPAIGSAVPDLGAATDAFTSTTSPTATTNDPLAQTTATAAAARATSRTGYAPRGSVVQPTPMTLAPPLSTTATAPADDTVTVTDEDNGKTFTLRMGQPLVVALDNSSSIWSDPDTDNSSVLTRTAVSVNPSATRVVASFDAKSVGQAHVSASKDQPCRNAQPPCMAPTQLWQVTVNVIG
jgi:hypothetical protein